MPFSHRKKRIIRISLVAKTPGINLLILVSPTLMYRDHSYLDSARQKETLRLIFKGNLISLKLPSSPKCGSYSPNSEAGTPQLNSGS